MGVYKSFAEQKQDYLNTQRKYDKENTEIYTGTTPDNSSHTSESEIYTGSQTAGNTAGTAAAPKTAQATVTTPVAAQSPTVTAPATTASAPTASQAPATAQATTPTEGDAMTRFTQILGKSPEVKAAEEEKLQRANQSKQTVMKFFDALRYLGYTAGRNASTAPVQFADSSLPLQQSYEQARQTREKADAESAAYKMKIYEMMQQERQQKRQDEALALERQRQAEADERAKQQRAEESRYNKAKTEYQEAINRNLPQKQEDEHTVKMSQANKNDKYVPGSRGGSRSSGGKSKDDIWNEYEKYLHDNPDEKPGITNRPKTKDQAHEWLAEHRGGKGKTGGGRKSKKGSKKLSKH